MTDRKINVLAEPFDLLDGETCYCCDAPAVVAIRGASPTYPVTERLKEEFRYLRQDRHCRTA